MYDATKLADEAGRLAALRRYQVLDSVPEVEFSQIVGLVRDIFQASHAAVNLIDEDRMWMMAAAGMPRGEYPRRETFCDLTIRSGGPLAIADLLRDARFRDNGFVQGQARLRAYLGVPLTSPDGYNVGSLCVMHGAPRGFSDMDADILRRFSRLVVSQLEMRLIAQEDELTGALTRRAFLQRLDRALQDPAPFALLLLDLDHFKTINDDFGHPVGDLVLKATARIIAQEVRAGDAFGRLGGEEFGLLLPASGPRDAMALAERVRRRVGDQVIARIGKPVTLSLGVALRQADCDRASMLLSADLALYEAKRAGRNLCRLHARPG